MIDVLFDLAGEEETRHVMAHLRECPVCEEAFAAYARQRERLRSRPALRVDAAPPRPLPARSRMRFSPRWTVVCAGALAIAIVAWAALPRRDDGTTYWLPLETDVMQLRADADGAFPDFVAGLEAYMRHDAGSAVAQLERTPASDDETVGSLQTLYLASALVNDGRGTEALPLLEDLRIETLPSKWRGRANWVRYLALRQGGDDAAAATLLDRLVARPGEIGNLARRERERRGGR